MINDIKSTVNDANGKTQIRVNVWDYPSVRCDKCASEKFIPAFIFKKIPGLLVGTGTQEHIQPVPVHVCWSCGELMPVYKQDIENAKKSKLDSSIFI